METQYTRDIRQYLHVPVFTIHHRAIPLQNQKTKIAL